jgi:hypothetical protein
MLRREETPGDRETETRGKGESEPRIMGYRRSRREKYLTTLAGMCYKSAIFWG